jgi:hypothetical protein
MKLNDLELNESGYLPLKVERAKKKKILQVIKIALRIEWIYFLLLMAAVLHIFR